MAFCFDYRARLKIAIIGIAIFALLSNLSMLKGTLAKYRGKLSGPDDISAYESRFAELRTLLPARGVIAYTSGANPQRLDVVEVVGVEHASSQKKYRLAQYALSPLLLRPATDGAIRELEWLVVDEYGAVFDRAAPRQTVRVAEEFVLLKDFENGLLLYRKRGR